MKLEIFPAPEQANEAAAECLASWLADPAVRNVMVAAGNSPLELYRRIAQRGLSLAHLNLFALDEYAGIPIDEPRNCANLLRRSVVEAWGIPEAHYFSVSSVEEEAFESVRSHERRILELGGLDVTVLGLGQNGHLGFNEPGSARDSPGRVLDLDAISVEANRKWFGSDYAPARGATTGLKTILSSKKILMLAYGSHKAAAVQAMAQRPPSEQCPASLLQGHAEAMVFLDAAAAENLNRARHEKSILRHWH